MVYLLFVIFDFRDWYDTCLKKGLEEDMCLEL